MPQYVAFLAGINVGNRRVKMAALQAHLQDLGCSEVKTVLATGNAIFKSSETTTEKVASELEAGLSSALGFPVVVIMLRAKDIATLVSSSPFAEIPQTPATRLYVTFLREKTTDTDTNLASDLDGFRILTQTEQYVCSMLEASEHINTPEVMSVLKKMFGAAITTRNWNTVQKIAQMLE